MVAGACEPRPVSLGGLRAASATRVLHCRGRRKLARDANRTLTCCRPEGLDGSFVTFAGGASVAAGGVGNGLLPLAGRGNSVAAGGIGGGLMPFVGGASVAAGGLGNGLLPVAGGDGVAAGGTGSGLLTVAAGGVPVPGVGKVCPGGSLTTPGSRGRRPADSGC